MDAPKLTSFDSVFDAINVSLVVCCISEDDPGLSRYLKLSDLKLIHFVVAFACFDSFVYFGVIVSLFRFFERDSVYFEGTVSDLLV